MSFNHATTALMKPQTATLNVPLPNCPRPPLTSSVKEEEMVDLQANDCAQSSQEMPSLISLPTELVVEIMLRARVPDIVRLRQTCVRFLEISRNRLLWLSLAREIMHLCNLEDSQAVSTENMTAAALESFTLRPHRFQKMLQSQLPQESLPHSLNLPEPQGFPNDPLSYSHISDVLLGRWIALTAETHKRRPGPIVSGDAFRASAMEIWDLGLGMVSELPRRVIRVVFQGRARQIAFRAHESQQSMATLCLLFLGADVHGQVDVMCNIYSVALPIADSSCVSVMRSLSIGNRPLRSMQWEGRFMVWNFIDLIVLYDPYNDRAGAVQSPRGASFLPWLANGHQYDFDFCLTDSEILISESSESNNLTISASPLPRMHKRPAHLGLLDFARGLADFHIPVARYTILPRDDAPDPMLPFYFVRFVGPRALYVFDGERSVVLAPFSKHIIPMSATLASPEAGLGELKSNGPLACIESVLGALDRLQDMCTNGERVVNPLVFVHCAGGVGVIRRGRVALVLPVGSQHRNQQVVQIAVDELSGRITVLEHGGRVRVVDWGSDPPRDFEASDDD